jgi:hypothetical protein
VVEQLRAREPVGVQRLDLAFIGKNLAALLEDVERLASEVRPRFDLAGDHAEPSWP